MIKAVFLDRDGTINYDSGYVIDPKKFHFLDGAVEGLKRIQEKGYLIFIVTNQSGVARGYFSESDVCALHQYLEGELAKHGVHIDAIDYCPYYQTGSGDQYDKPSSCRKPNSGMLTKLARRYGVDVENSYMVGDKEADIEAGRYFGCKTVLVLTGEGEKARENMVSSPDCIVANLEEASHYIV